MPTATLSLFRFQGLGPRLWVIGQMALARLALRRAPHLMFWKLCGSGTGEGFTPRPNWGVWAILAVWPDEATARLQTTQSPVWRRWRHRAVEGCTVFMQPLSARGSWGGVNPFVPEPQTVSQTVSPPDEATGPLAVLTRASVKPRRVLRFWARVPDISAVIGQDPSVLFKIGIGEVPLLHQTTFSIWPDPASMARFARGDGPHGRAIQAVRAEGWFTDELYARFRVLGVAGNWNGVPLVLRGPEADPDAAPPPSPSPTGGEGSACPPPDLTPNLPATTHGAPPSHAA